LSALFLTFCFTLSLSAQEKVTVVATKGNIYAEPHAQAHLIESVAQGTVLTLFQKGKIQNDWYYVRFHSQRYGGPTTGFIKAEQVEPYSETTAAALPPPPELEMKKESAIKTEESQAATPLPAALALSTPTEDIPWKERTWLAREFSYTETSLPPSSGIPLPEPYTPLQELPWRESEIKNAQTGIPPGQIPEHRKAQESLKTEVFVPPEPPPPLPEKAKAVTLPAAVSFSRNIELTRSAETIEFDLGFGSYSSFRHFELTEPNRIVVDFLNVSEAAEMQRHRIDDIGLSAIRVAMFEATTARVVFDFQEEIPAYQFRETEKGLKLLFWTEAARTTVTTDVEPIPKAPPQPDPEIKLEPLTEEFTADTDLPSPMALLPGLILAVSLSSAPLEERYWPTPSPTEEPEREPEARTEELLSDTSLPVAASLALPRTHALPGEQVWTAREEVFMDTPPVPGMVLVFPLPQPQPEERIWVAAPRPSPPDIEPEIVEKVPEKKAEEKPEQQIIPKPQISPPVPAPQTIGPISLSVGVGTSLGGAGGFVQFHANERLAVHAGMGMFPTSLVYSDTDWVKNKMLYSVGLKYYAPFKSRYLRPYLDVQYGGITVEAVQIIVGIWDYEYIYQNEQKTLYGPSALLGGEVKLGALGLNLAAGVSYAVTPWEWKPQDFYFSFDISLLYNFR
jgi:hypothetical protein